jgi:SNF family Na+-dependent transporter
MEILILSQQEKVFLRTLIEFPLPMFQYTMSFILTYFSIIIKWVLIFFVHEIIHSLEGNVNSSHWKSHQNKSQTNLQNEMILCEKWDVHQD